MRYSEVRPLLRESFYFSIGAVRFCEGLVIEIFLSAGPEAHAALQRAGAAAAWAPGHRAAAALFAAVPAPAQEGRQPAARESAAPQALQEPHHPGLQDPRRRRGQHVTGEPSS